MYRLKFKVKRFIMSTRLYHKLIRNYDLKSILILILASALFFNYSNFKSQCVSFFEKNKNRNEPIVFIGGFPRSGTTLMRVMLDAHPDVRCGEETRILPNILETAVTEWIFNDDVSESLLSSGITKDILDFAISAFIYEIISRHGKPAKYLCNKDPFLLKHTIYLSKLFPKSKFILMIRDARGSINSILKRNIRISNFKKDNLIQSFVFWNNAVETMYSECVSIGIDRCLPVYYEKLVLKPGDEMKRILNFLDIPWDKAVLSHEKYIGEKISLSKSEKSSDQVIKPVNLLALNEWQENEDILNLLDKLDTFAPMLKKLGYDSKSNSTNYGEADLKVISDTLNIKENKQYWDDIANKLLNPT